MKIYHLSLWWKFIIYHCDKNALQWWNLSFWWMVIIYHYLIPRWNENYSHRIYHFDYIGATQYVNQLFFSKSDFIWPFLYFPGVGRWAKIVKTSWSWNWDWAWLKGLGAHIIIVYKLLSTSLHQLARGLQYTLLGSRWGGGYLIRGLGHKISCVEEECGRKITESESVKDSNVPCYQL